MKIAYYCQHVLGVGHFHRSLEICRALARHHNVTMITGGKNLDINEEEVGFFSLPGLMMNREFKNLAPCQTGKEIEEIKAERKDLLFEYFKKNQPEIFLVELYPFGRKAFRFELDPILEAIKDQKLSPCLALCSLRDILVERDDRVKFEKRIITTMNTLFDGLLIHADQKFSSLDETFSRVEDIAVPIVYTGYVTPKPARNSREKIRERLQLRHDSRLVVASIGGGNVGQELLVNLADAFKQLNNKKLFLQIFTGPYAESHLYSKLQGMEDEHMGVARFTQNFPDWLAAADLSFSMAGYNTCMNTLAAGVPAFFYPFRQNQEQLMRVGKLVEQLPISILEEVDLQPDCLSRLITENLNQKRYSSPIDLNGATNTLLSLENWPRQLNTT